MRPVCEPDAHIYNSEIKAASRVIARDHCVKCGYVRKFHNGRTYTRESPIDLFMKRTRRDPDSGCLIWTGGTNDKGYPSFTHTDHEGVSRGESAHRWIFREKHGYYPEVVMHRCDTPLCVDWVRCLRAGTHAENMADMIRKKRDKHDSALKRFTESQVRSIRSRYGSGDAADTAKAMAVEFGFSINAIRDAARGNTYEWVE